MECCMLAGRHPYIRASGCRSDANKKKEAWGTIGAGSVFYYGCLIVSVHTGTRPQIYSVAVHAVCI